MNFNSKSLIAIAVVLIILAGGLGFLLGRTKQTLKPTEKIQTSVKNSLFVEQRAYFQGEIIKFSDGKATLKNKQGETSEFPVSARPLIYKPTNSNKSAIPSQDPKQIELNKEALIVLTVDNEGYKITSISYLGNGQSEGATLPSKTITPAATNSAKTP